MSDSTRLLPAAQSYAEMENTGNELAGWLWQGFIAFGSITLLTSRWKMGKTTLLSVLLSRLQAGGALAGLDVARAPALVVSEGTRPANDLVGASVMVGISEMTEVHHVRRDGSGFARRAGTRLA